MSWCSIYKKYLCTTGGVIGSTDGFGTTRDHEDYILDCGDQEQETIARP